MNTTDYNQFISPQTTCVTEVKESLEKKKMEERLREILDTMLEGCQVIDSNFRYVYVNETVAKQGHRTKEELLGHTMMEMYPGIEKTKMFGYLRHSMKERKPQKIENEFIYPDGSHGWFELRMEPVPDGILIFSLDITERKKTEAAIEVRTKELEILTKSQEIEKAKDEAMLNSIGEGLIAVDNNQKIMIINKSAEKMTGWKLKDIVGKEITSLSLEDEDGHFIPFDKRPTYIAIATGTQVNVTNFFVRKDKTRFPIAITVTPIKLGEKIIGAIDMFRDITHEKEIENAKNEFVSIASHQLRTPLGISKWYLEAIGGAGYLSKAPDILIKYFDEIYKNNERLLILVRNLLSVSRIDQGKVKDIPQKVNIIELMKKIINDMRISALKQHISVSLKIQNTNISDIIIDPLKLRETIENLISNAIKYSTHHGNVDVILSRKSDSFLISVTDKGIGISDEDKKKLFTKFFRSEKAVKHSPEGSGLGLYVVKSYVESWGGKIAVESSKGKGSTFLISIPIVIQKKEKGVIL